MTDVSEALGFLSVVVMVLMVLVVVHLVGHDR